MEDYSDGCGPCRGTCGFRGIEVYHSKISREMLLVGRLGHPCGTRKLKTYIDLQRDADCCRQES